MRELIGTRSGHSIQASQQILGLRTPIGCLIGGLIRRGGNFDWAFFGFPLLLRVWKHTRFFMQGVLWVHVHAVGIHCERVGTIPKADRAGGSESVSSMDLPLQIQLLDLFTDLRRYWVFTTHDLRLVRRFRDQVAVLPTAN